MTRLSLWLLLALPATAGAEVVALLPVEGEPALASSLERELPATLRRRGLSLAAPGTLRQRLAGDASPGPAARHATKLLEEANSALLGMRRAQAASSARQAITALEQAGARFFARSELAMAYEVLARALLLKPADPSGAAEAAARAVAMDPAHAPDPDRSPPRVRVLFERARERVAPLAAPTATALASVAAAARADRLLWVSVTRVDSGVRLELVVFSSASGHIERHDHFTVLEPRLLEGAASRVAAALGSSATRPAASTPLKPPASGGGSAPVVPTVEKPVPRVAPLGRPWYKRWWVWTIAGVVVAGAAVGLGVGLSQGSQADSGWDISFSF